MSTVIKEMLQDMRQLRDSLQHSLIDVPNYAINQRVDELTKQIEAVEALQAGADHDILSVNRADAERYRALRSCAMEPDSALAASMDAAISAAFERHGLVAPATYAEFDSVVDEAIAAANAVRAP